MAEIWVEVQGMGVIGATQELLAMPGVTGTWETEKQLTSATVRSPAPV